MKKAFRIFSLLTVSALYSFVIGLYSSNAFIDNFTHSQTNPDAKQYSSLISSTLLYHTAQTESSFTVRTNVPPSSLKNPFNEFPAYLRTTEQLFFNVFSQYRFYSQNLLVRLLKTDLIFPFHYFW